MATEKYMTEALRMLRKIRNDDSISDVTKINRLETVSDELNVMIEEAQKELEDSLTL